jgi:hypothetical protein
MRDWLTRQAQLSDGCSFATPAPTLYVDGCEAQLERFTYKNKDGTDATLKQLMVPHHRHAEFLSSASAMSVVSSLISEAF